MKILYLTTDFGVPVRGTKGASVHVRRLVGALDRRGHEVVILTPSPGAGPADPPAARVVALPLSGAPAALYEHAKAEEICAGNRLSKDLRNLVYTLWLAGRAAPLVEELRPDAIYERYTLFGTAGLELARRFDVPLLLEVNAPLVEEQREQRGLSLPGVATAAQREVFRGADELIVVSRWLEEYAVAHGASAERVTVLPNAADPELFAPRDEPSAIRERLGWRDSTVLGFVGAMKTWHGVPTLVEALDALGGAGSRFRLLLVGDGPALPEVRRQVSARGLDGVVHMPGAVSHADVPDWLAAADVALVPYAATAAEYFSPVKLFECMSMGMPVVAARRGQTAELVDDGNTGWLYEPGDPVDLAKTIERVSADRGALARVGAAARRHVLAHHTWDRNAERVERLATRAARRREAAGAPRLAHVASEIAGGDA